MRLPRDNMWLMVDCASYYSKAACSVVYRRKAPVRTGVQSEI